MSDPPKLRLVPPASEKPEAPTGGTIKLDNHRTLVELADAWERRAENSEHRAADALELRARESERSANEAVRTADRPWGFGTTQPGLLRKLQARTARVSARSVRAPAVRAPGSWESLFKVGLVGAMAWGALRLWKRRSSPQSEPEVDWTSADVASVPGVTNMTNVTNVTNVTNHITQNVTEVIHRERVVEVAKPGPRGRAGQSGARGPRGRDGSVIAQGLRIEKPKISGLAGKL